jgi:NAD(P)-dependent dehydrogenase (short-subunit alcohol dehydrogenase family)
MNVRPSLTGKVGTLSRHLDDLTSLTRHVIQADVSDPDAVQQAAATAREQVTSVDLWIYAAGDITATRVAEMTPHTWQRILDANLLDP